MSGVTSHSVAARLYYPVLCQTDEHLGKWMVAEVLLCAVRTGARLHDFVPASDDEVLIAFALALVSVAPVVFVLDLVDEHSNGFVVVPAHERLNFALGAKAEGLDGFVLAVVAPAIAVVDEYVAGDSVVARQYRAPPVAGSD